MESELSIDLINILIIQWPVDTDSSCYSWLVMCM